VKATIALYDHLPDIARIEALSYHPDLVTSVEGFTKILDSTGVLGELLVVLDQKKEVMGFAHFSLAEPRLLTLFDIAVDPSRRNRGVAKLALKRLLRMARDEKRKLIRLNVPQANAAALSLYFRMGFRAVSVLEKYYPEAKDGWVMELKLGK
jgi:ribosomal protein S18 acetylase RimI-like enzyme